MDDLVDNEVANHNMVIFIGETIHRQYPARNWMVNLSDCGTVATILCPDISTQWGYCIDMNDNKFAVEAKAKRAAGEILERFNLSRGRFDGDTSSLLVNHKGEAIGAEVGYQ